MMEDKAYRQRRLRRIMESLEYELGLQALDIEIEDFRKILDAANALKAALRLTP